MSFTSYPSYKDSGVEWLGEVPEHWEVTRLSSDTSILAGHSFDASLFGFEGIPVIRMSDFGGGFVQLEDAKRVEPSYIPEKSLAQAGDVLLGLSGSISNFAEVREQDLPIAINQRVAIVRINEAERGIVKWFLQSSEFTGQIAAGLPETTIQNISMGQLRQCRLPKPPTDERTTIAAFLDRETAKIDELVTEQRRLMELLKEKRQAVISHAVTQGLNPHAPMKPSGIEWIGDVPEHWEVKRLKHNLRLLTEKTDRRDHPVALENIEGWTGRFIPTETEFEGEGIAFDAGDILFGKLRPYLAKAYRAESSGEAVGDFHVMRPVSGINSRFAQYQILNREFISIVDGSTFGSKMPRASWEFVGGVKVTTPPLPEQTQIAAFLDTESAKFDILTTEAQRAIDLLQERRTALISAAVTGQIDVKEVA